MRNRPEVHYHDLSEHQLLLREVLNEVGRFLPFWVDIVWETYT
jgi:hypothetical protein